MTVTVPANVSGLALLQCHMVGGIAHLRGYDLARPAGPQRGDGLHARRATRVKRAVKRKKLPSSPMAIATAPAYDPMLDHRIAAEVAASSSPGSPASATIAALGRKVPVGRRRRRRR